MSRVFAALCIVIAWATGGDVRAQPVLKGPELAAALVGKTYRIRTEQRPVGDPANPRGTTRRGDGGHTMIEMYFRQDNSLLFKCTNFDRTGASRACTMTGGDGTRDVGVWSLKSDRLCYQYLTTRGGQERCFAVLREGSELRLRQESGSPSSINGERLERK